MSGVNKAILIGRLGKDPEVRHLESGVAVANFPIATSETYKDRNTGEKVEQTEWHNIVLWRGLADVAEKYLHKGDLVYIEGKLRTRSWEKDGVTRYTTEIVGDSMNMLTPRSESTGSGMSGAGGGASNSGAGNYSSQSSTSQPSSSGQQVSEPSGNTNTGSETEEDDLPF